MGSVCALTPLVGETCTCDKALELNTHTPGKYKKGWGKLSDLWTVPTPAFWL